VMALQFAQNNLARVRFTTDTDELVRLTRTDSNFIKYSNLLILHCTQK
jgi:hypothetical protein